MPIPPARIVSSALLAALLTWLIAWQPFNWNGPSQRCFLELSIATPEKGGLAIHLDDGHGYDLPADGGMVFERSDAFHSVRLQISPGQIRAIKLHVFYSPKLLLSSARLRMSDGRVLADLMESLQPKEKTAIRATPYGRLLEAPPGVSPFAVEFAPSQAIEVPTGDEPWAAEVLGEFLALTALLTLVQTAMLRRVKPEAAAWWRGLGATVAASLAARPALTLGAVALAAAVGSSLPVALGNKSLVAPNAAVRLLYDRNPTLPGAPVEPSENTKGADVWAIAYAHLPYSVLEYQALFRDHELPLWNRYNFCGVPLFGQGQTMFGDPLHFIPLLAGGAWWAWDLKYILAKALFSLGIGLCIWNLTRRLGLAALLGASSVWIGYFGYRFNHPAIFSLCYSPWVLLPWLWALRAQTRGALGWPAAMLILTDWAELASGTAKEASMLLLSMNCVGFAIVAVSAPDGKTRRRQLGGFVWASLLFLMLSAPHWLVFIDAVRQMRNIYEVPHAYQLRPGHLAGFFDEILTQDSNFLGLHIHPSLNFFILSGVLWFAATWREQRRDRVGVTLAAAALFFAGLVFGIVPAAWIIATPLLASIHHIHNTFGCVLLVLVLLLAGLGFRNCLETGDAADWTATWRRTLGGWIVLLLLYLGFNQALPAPSRLSDEASFTLAPVLHSPFFRLYVPFIIAAAAAAPWTIRGLRARGEWRIAAAAGFCCCLVATHFRHGMYWHTRFDDYVMNPRTGFDLVAKSPAVDLVKQRLARPYRTSGFGRTLSAGYNAMLGLEGIGGSDALMNGYEHELCAAGGIAYEFDWRVLVAPGTMKELKPIYDLLNLRYYLRPPAPAPPAGLVKVAQSDLEVDESKEAWPRAFFTDSVESYETPEQLARRVKRGDGRPLAAFQGTGGPASPAKYADRQIAPASDYRLTTNTTEFSIKAPGPGVVVLSECFEKGNFVATVNGQPAPYFRVNHAFKGIWLDRAGDFRIRFSYWPRFLTPGLWLSALGALLALATVGWVRWGGSGGRSTCSHP